MLRFPSLRYFVAIVRYGSMREAATNINIAQSALSRQMANLEYELGVKLFERMPRGIKLTLAGERLLEFSRDFDQRVGELEQDLRTLDGRWTGTISIYAPETIVLDFLPSAISAFSQIHPHVSFDVKISSNQRIIAAVGSGAARLGLAGAQLSPTVPNTNVTTLFSVPDPFAALVSRDHPLAGENSISVRQAVAYPFATLSRDAQGRNLIDSAVARSQSGYHPALETNSIQLLVDFVSNSLGITLLPMRAARSAIQNGDVVALPISDPMLSSTKLHVLSNANHQLPDFVAGFVEHLKLKIH